MKKITPFALLLIVLTSAILAVFLYYPTLFIVQKAFFPIDHFSLEFFALVLKNATLLSAMLNSFMLGTIVTLLCVIIAAPLAWISGRYRLRGEWLWNGWMMLPMILPPFVGAIGLRLFLSRFGTLNLILMKFGIIHEPIDWLASGFWGVVILQTLHLFPIIYLNLTAVLANIDPSLEEAAHNLGARRTQLWRKIVLPLAAPGLFSGCAIVFIWSITDLGTPLILEYRSVVAYQIYSMINDIYENPLGYALVVCMLAWIALMYYATQHFLVTPHTHMNIRAARATIKPVASKTIQIVGIGLFLLYGCAAVIPHAMVIISSIADKWFITIFPEHVTAGFYQSLSNNPLTVSSMRNSIFLSAVATMIDIVLGLAGAYVVARYRFFGRRLLDFSLMLPLALPGLILAFGYVGTFAGTPLDPRQNPFPLLIIAYSIRRLPFMVRSIDAGLRQLDVSLEESAANLGSSSFKTIRRITMPLVSPNILAGGMLVFAFAMLEVSDSMILAMKENYYPLTKAIYMLVNRIADGFGLASALGVIAMVLLGGSLIVAGRILGKKMGELFRM